MNTWTTSRKDMASFTENPEGGGFTNVVYIYREPEQRIAVFGPKNREHAELIIEAVNAYLTRKEGK